MDRELIKITIREGQKIAQTAFNNFNFILSGKKLDEDYTQVFMGAFEKKFEELNK